MFALSILHLGLAVFTCPRVWPFMFGAAFCAYFVGKFVEQNSRERE